MEDLKYFIRDSVFFCFFCKTQNKVIVPDEITDTWGQLVLLTTILNHKICINTSRQVLEKILFAINAIFSKESINSE